MWPHTYLVAIGSNGGHAERTDTRSKGTNEPGPTCDAQLPSSGCGSVAQEGGEYRMRQRALRTR
jgi:hypothetical protein